MDKVLDLPNLPVTDIRHADLISPEAAPELDTTLMSTDEASRGIVDASLKISISQDGRPCEIK